MQSSSQAATSGNSHRSTTTWGLPFLTHFQCNFTDENSNVLMHCNWSYSVTLLLTVDLAMKSPECSRSLHKQFSCVMGLKASFFSLGDTVELFLLHVVSTVFQRSAGCRAGIRYKFMKFRSSLGWSIEEQNFACKDVAWFKKLVWERFIASGCDDCGHPVWILNSVSYQLLFGQYIQF